MRPIWSILTVTMLLFPACASHRVQESIHYAVVDRDAVIARDDSVDVRRLADLRRRLDADFVWFERDGVQSVTADAVIVAVANRTIEPLREARATTGLAIGSGMGAARYAQEVRYASPPNSDPFSATFYRAPLSSYVDEMTRSSSSRIEAGEAQQRTTKQIDASMIDLFNLAVRNGSAMEIRR